uniref:MRG domain-containing protein n=1 Tax=Syphacia muris TaxID=451379 RepID=A0A0N5ADK6_9BILA
MYIIILQNPSYSVNERVLCKCEDGLYYEAKIVRIGRTEDGTLYYKVHYQGWSKTYDEIIFQGMVPSRFISITPETLEEALNARNARREIDKVDKDKKCKRRSSKNYIAGQKELDYEGVNESASTAATTSYIANRLARKRSFTSTSSCSEVELNVPTSVATPQNTEVSVACRSGGDRPVVNVKFNQCDLVGDNFVSKWVSDALLVILERDRQLIEIDLKFRRLPAKYTASKIVAEYAKHIRQINKTNKNQFTGEKAASWKLFMKGFDECSEAFLDVFDIIVPDRLLNNNEKLRHQDLVDKGVVCLFDIADIFEDSKRGLRPSQCYGFIHVVRLLADFEDILKSWSAPGVTTQIFEIFVKAFLKWLGENVPRYVNFAADYETTVCQE